MQTITTTNAPGAIGAYSQGIQTDFLVWTSGQLPINNATGELEVDDIRAATKYALENCAAILQSGGTSINNAVKTTVFLTDLANFADFNDAYAAFFAEVGQSTFPARSCVQVAALPKGAPIEIEVVACLP
jgi:2-iminobutanoate/2-iminopropanoate deaminase